MLPTLFRHHALTRDVRLVGLTILLGIAGAAIALGWLSLIGGTASLEVLSRVRPGHIVLLVTLTAVNVFIRFFRWHFLLRRVHVKIPTRASLSIYLASLAATATPAYVGEVVRPVLVKHRFGAALSSTLPVLVTERALDVLALAAIGIGTSENRLVLVATGTGAAVVLAALLVAARFARQAPLTAAAVGRLTRARVMVPAIGLSFLAWLPACLIVSVSAAALGFSVPLREGIGTFSRATLFGAVTLMPAGIGTTGSAAIIALQENGLDVRTSVSIVSVVRLATTGLTFAVGILFLVAALRRVRATALRDSVEHFDAIADVYVAELPAHIRHLLVTRKTDLLHARLAQSQQPLVRGLDVGCGHGAHAVELGRRGYRVIGAEPSRSVWRARDAGATVVAGSGADLPFRDGAFDFVYVIGVLHHLREDTRTRALGEIRRVLRRGGLLLVHETNPRNPAFRFYMGYVFPITRRIDEGTEEWLDPELQQVPGMTRLSTDYTTFMPDFAPRLLLPLMLRVERRLERSRFRGYAAHFLAVYEATG
jgi:SAM-dependent methyltransferase/uncharacterized membrane protein YbhN (UPF0104 family)